MLNLKDVCWYSDHGKAHEVLGHQTRRRSQGDEQTRSRFRKQKEIILEVRKMCKKPEPILTLSL